MSPLLEASFPLKMLTAIKQAYQYKILNKTCELDWERQGEILCHTICQQNQSPPAYILVKMTQEEKRIDKLARSISEVGSVMMAKDIAG